MPEEMTGTAPETAPAEVIVAAAAAQPESPPESSDVQTERFTVAASFAPPSANDDNRTIDAVWYTGAKVPRFDWRTGEEYDLTLDMKGCRMDRLNNGGPVLDSHSAYGVESQLGVVRQAWANKNTGRATIQFSKRDAVTPIWSDVKGGIIQNLSPGMWIYTKVDTTPKGQERREFTATDWEPFEISLVSVPADADTNFMSAAGTPPAPTHIKEKPDMEPTTQDTGLEARQIDSVSLAAARDEAVKAERLRASTIRAMATGPFKVEESFLVALIDEGVSIEIARERIMTKLDAEYRMHPIVPVNGPATLGVTDEADKRREGMEAALLLRGSPRASGEMAEKGRDYAGLTLVDMARECLAAAGVKTRGMSRNEIARVALQGRHGASEYFEGAMAALKPAFNHLTANFADQDYRFVNNSVTVYDIDYATQIGGGAGPLFLKSNVNLCGTFTKSQAARIISTRLREELGGINAAEWKAARQIAFRTTVLALNTEPGMVCSMTHDDMPGGSGEFRVSSWKLNKDYSIDIQGRTTTDSMYDLVDGPKPADVLPSFIPDELFYDTGVPGIVTGTPKVTDYGRYAVDNIVVLPDDSGNDNIAGATEIAMGVYYVDELATDLWASLDAALDATTDPATVNCTVNPDAARTFKVGDFILFNDEAADANNAGRRSYECAQIVGPGNVGDVVPTGSFQFQRMYPGVPAGQATFETIRCAHLKGIRFYKLDMKIFGMPVKKSFFRTPGLPARMEVTLPSVCIVAVLVAVANHFGYGPITVFPQSHHSEPLMPGDRTCSGGAYTFQIPGPLAAQDNVAIPMKVHDAASIRCVYAYLQQGTTDGQSAYVVKYSTDGGATWNVLEKMGIAQNVGTAYKNSWDYLVAQGYGKPETRRLPYADYGLFTAQAVTASATQQTIQTSSFDASTTGLEVGRFVFLDFGTAAEECVEVLAVDPANQTFDAIVTKNHSEGAPVRPCIWPTPILYEGNDLAFDIKAVASPDPGSDLTVVIQT